MSVTKNADIRVYTMYIII